MGKRIRGASLRARKRAKDAATEMVEETAKTVELRPHREKKDHELFVVDTTAKEVPSIPRHRGRGGKSDDDDENKTKKNNAEQHRMKKKKKKNEPPLLVKSKVDELLKKHSKDELTLMAEKGKNQAEIAKRTKRTIGNCRPSFDLWESGPTAKGVGGGSGKNDDDNDDDDASQPQQPKASSSDSDSAAATAAAVVVSNPGIGGSLSGVAPSHVRWKGGGRAAAGAAAAASSTHHKNAIAVQVAHAGQSYHPDPEHHQDIIGEALALELRRKEAVAYKKAPISKGMSEETRALLVGSDTEEDDDDEDDDDNDDDREGHMSIVKKSEKLTRAQRNKRKRHKQLLKEEAARKKQKKMMSAVSELKKLNKELNKEEEEKRRSKEMIEELKKQSQQTPGKDVYQKVSKKDPEEAPTLPVALTEELKGSLRTVKPKGSLLEDRFESFRDRKMADQKQIGDKRKVVQGKRRVKVKGRKKIQVKRDDGGGDMLLL